MSTVPRETDNHLINGDISGGDVEASEVVREFCQKRLEFGVPVLIGFKRGGYVKVIFYLLEMITGHQSANIVMREQGGSRLKILNKAPGNKDTKIDDDAYKDVELPRCSVLPLMSPLVQTGVLLCSIGVGVGCKLGEDRVAEKEGKDSQGGGQSFAKKKSRGKVGVPAWGEERCCRRWVPQGTWVQPSWHKLSFWWLVW